MRRRNTDAGIANLKQHMILFHAIGKAYMTLFSKLNGIREQIGYHLPPVLSANAPYIVHGIFPLY